MQCKMIHCDIIAPERSGGASYSESGVSNDQVCIRSSDVFTGKNGQNTKNMCAGQEDLLFAVFVQSIFKVSKKLKNREKGMIWRDA